MKAKLFYVCLYNEEDRTLFLIQSLKLYDTITSNCWVYIANKIWKNIYYCKYFTITKWIMVKNYVVMKKYVMKYNYTTSKKYVCFYLPYIYIFSTKNTMFRPDNIRCYKRVGYNSETKIHWYEMIRTWNR